jgi:hypothetical protein
LEVAEVYGGWLLSPNGEDGCLVFDDRRSLKVVTVNVELCCRQWRTKKKKRGVLVSAGRIREAGRVYFLKRKLHFPSLKFDLPSI